MYVLTCHRAFIRLRQGCRNCHNLVYLFQTQTQIQMQSKYPYSARTKKELIMKLSLQKFCTKLEFFIDVDSCTKWEWDTTSLVMPTWMLFCCGELLMTSPKLIWHMKIIYMPCPYTAYMTLLESLP